MKHNYFTYSVLLLLFTGVFVSCNEDDSSFLDGYPDSVINTDPEGAPARRIQESWNGHTDTLYREFLSEDFITALYYDEEVDREITWTRDFSHDVWDYVLDSYGNYSNTDALYAVFHGRDVSPYSATRFYPDSGQRFITDMTLSNSEMNAQEADIFVHLISNIVEESAFNIDGSAARELWKESWSEIFTYDIYMGLGMQEHADRVLNEYSNSSYNYPNEGTYWFRDWFLPLYENYNGTTTLNNFFRVLSANFPVSSGAYSRDMNMGEFVHFFSGATGEDLQPMAEEVFGWSDEWQLQLETARTNFPDLNYPFEPTSELVDVTFDATLTVSRDNGGGPTAGEGSLKLIDNDIETKFLTDGFPDVELWMQQELPEAVTVNSYSMTSANDAPGRDPRTWELLASNDGENWTTLDERENIEFTERFQTQTFNIENMEAYIYYRINMLENNGEGLFQQAEWRLFSLQPISNEPEDFTGDATLTVSNENINGATGAEGSLKLVDGDIETKFLTSEYSAEFWMQQELPEEKVVNLYTLTSANDAPDRDPVTWELVASDDGENWTTLDTRTDETFETRHMTREFFVNNSEAYKYYRVNVTENNGSDAIQLSEWRLLNE